MGMDTRMQWSQHFIGNAPLFRNLAGTEDDLNKCKFDLGSILFGFDFLFGWLALLGLITAVAESMLHQLEHYFRDRLMYLQLLRRVYKELTLLGFMSFILILMRDFGQLTKTEFQIIELAHLWLFAVGISFIAQAVQAALGVRNSKSRWEDSFALGLKRLDQSYRAKTGITGFLERRRSRHKAQLWILRKHFLKKNQLPKSFSFSKYLRKTLSRRLLVDFDIGWRSWLVLCMIFTAAFGISRGLQDGDVPLDFERTALVSLSLTLLIFFLSLFLLMLIRIGKFKMLRRAGLKGSPTDFENVIETARDLYREEGEDILDKFGSLTADEYRLEQIFEECRTKDHIDDPDYIKSHNVYDVTHLNHHHEPGIFVTQHRLLFPVMAKLLMLLQAYIFGITVILLASWGSLNSVTKIPLIFEVIIHIIAVSSVFPRIVRNYALLDAVSVVDDDTLNLVEETFLFQQQTNEAVHALALVLHRAHAKLNTDIPDLFRKIDVERKGSVSAKTLQKALDGAPFRHHILQTNMRMIFRVLNCEKFGFTMKQCTFLIEGMQRFLNKEKLKAETFAKCFPQVQIECKQCFAQVFVADMASHAQQCEADKQQGQLSHQERASRCLSRRRIRNAKYGLLRPLLLSDRLIEEEEEEEEKVKINLDKPNQVTDSVVMSVEGGETHIVRDHEISLL